MAQLNNVKVAFEHWKDTDQKTASAVVDMLVSIHGYESGKACEYSCFTFDGYYIGTITQEELRNGYEKQSTVVLTPNINL